jgi:Flp pilus assembly protein TadD
MPTSAVPHYNMGLALVAQNRTAKAIEPYREAVKLLPGCANARNNLGRVAGVPPPGELGPLKS